MGSEVNVVGCLGGDPPGQWMPRVPCNASVAIEGQEGRRPCRLLAIPGGTVCPYHGGRTGLAKGRAADRIEQVRRTIIEEILPLAAVRLADLTASDDERIAMKAVENVLDRAGLQVVRKVEDVTPGAAGEALDAAITRLLQRGAVRAALDPGTVVETTAVEVAAQDGGQAT